MLLKQLDRQNRFIVFQNTTDKDMTLNVYMKNSFPLKEKTNWPHIFKCT